MRVALLASLFLLSGCAMSKGCFVGVSFLPLGPVLICGIDAAPPEKPE